MRAVFPPTGGRRGKASGPREAGGGGRPWRRHVGLEARTLPTLPGYESRRESSEPRLLTLPLEPAETRSSPGRGCVSWGLWDGGPPAPSQGRGKSGCEQQLLVLSCERLGSLSEASGRSSRLLVPQLPHPRSGVGPFPTHPFIRWGSKARGAQHITLHAIRSYGSFPLL